MSSLLERYTEEIAEDLKIDQFNVKEVQMRAPARKHFWVARLVNAKIKLNALKSKKSTLKHEIILRLIERSPTRMTQVAMSNAADNSRELKDIKEAVSDHEALVEYLEHVVKIIGSIQWDIKNIIDLMQMEMT